MRKSTSSAPIFETLVPFVIAGTAIALLIGLLFMFSYVLIWGLFIGGILWVASLIKQFLFPATAPQEEDLIQKRQGRIIEHNDKK